MQNQMCASVEILHIYIDLQESQRSLLLVEQNNNKILSTPAPMKTVQSPDRIKQRSRS